MRDPRRSVKDPRCIAHTDTQTVRCGYVDVVVTDGDVADRLRRPEAPERSLFVYRVREQADDRIEIWSQGGELGTGAGGISEAVSYLMPATSSGSVPPSGRRWVTSTRPTVYRFSYSCREWSGGSD